MESISNTHKVSDSGYSNSCSNSQSQRSGSSNSRKSGSHSSRSSGYCGHPLNATNSSEAAPEILTKRNKDSDHKKKKINSISTNGVVCPVAVECNDILIQTKTLLEDVNTDCNSPSNCKSDNNVVQCFAPIASPVLAKISEGNGQVLITSIPLLSPHTPKTADSAHIDVEMLSKRDEENISENHQNEHMDTSEEAVASPITVETGTKSFPCQPEDGFCCVISMHDGVVLYTTPSLTAVLGFPKDMWLGRSFIEFVHQKDRETFASEITSGLAEPLVDNDKQKKSIQNSVFVNLRKYRGLKNSGFVVVDSAVLYQPFKLTIRVRQVNGPNKPKYVDDSQGKFLVVVAVPVHSIYKVSNEKCKSTKFNTRHTSGCIISHADPEVVTNFGFFPQDMIGRSILDFYHPEDMPLIKEVYETVIVKCKTGGTVYRSQPYRFAVQNGGYATVETEWSSFVNPWSRKMEFVIEYHKILQGPYNPDVFSPRENLPLQIADNVLKESKSVKTNIHALLNQPIQLDLGKQQVSKRCKDLATFMESLLSDVSKSNLKLDILNETNVSVSNVSKNNIDGILSQIQERDSVMLGEISPHHEYCESKTSSATPPSYNQLNYNENIQRFFKSKPMTTVSDEINVPLLSTTDTDQEGKSSILVQECSSNQKCLSPVHCSGASGSGSGNLSSESNPQMENGTTSGTTFSNDSYKPPHLTEALLVKHNSEMEKIMMRKHKDQRSINKTERDGKKPHQRKITNNIRPDNSGLQHHGTHGVKRSGSHSWDADNHKVSKHQYKCESKHMQKSNFQNGNQRELAKQNNTMSNNASIPNENLYSQSEADSINLWPPFSVSVTPLQTTQPCTTNMTTPGGHTTGMFPTMYYIPAHTGQSPREYPGPPMLGHSSQYQFQYVPSMMYPTVFGTYSIMYPSVAMLQPMSVPVQQQVTSRTNATEIKVTEAPKPNTSVSYNVTATAKGLFQRPASQATSVKAEPGSFVGSIASASVANRAMSECSRKDIGLQSVCSPDSPMVSPQDGEMIIEHYGKAAKRAENTRTILEVNAVCSLEGDEDSDSSFYSSFLKTDTGSGSNEDINNQDVKQEKSDSKEIIWKKPKVCPITKPDPPWLDNVQVTPELIYRYQMDLKELGDILQADLNSLKDITQPEMVNEQLSQLYYEMELEGLSMKLTLEDNMTSNSSSSEDENTKSIKPKRKRRSYSELVMIFEEDAPMPHPNSKV